MKVLLGSMANLPYHILIEVSSRVPTAPGLGRRAASWAGRSERNPNLGRVHQPGRGWIHQSARPTRRIPAKVEAAHRLNKIANGHAAGLVGRELAAYICGGMADDHEAVDYEEAFARLRLGLPVLVRDGSTERNLEPILRGVVREGLDTRHLMFCTDDKHPDDIRDEGHIDYLVNRAIELGVPPIQAIQMASVNAAVHFRIDHLLGSLAPGRWADVVLAGSLDRIQPSHVFFKGELVAQDGRLVVSPPPADYPEWIHNTVTVRRGGRGEDFALRAEGPSVTARVIELYPDRSSTGPGRRRCRWSTAA